MRSIICQYAQELMQQYGYNGFSYRDIAHKVGIKTSSIHYYFPTKPDLVEAVIVEYLNTLEAELHSITSRNLALTDTLHLFFERIFSVTWSQDQRMCLGGMLASDVLTLPEPIRQKVRSFFRRVESWLEVTLNQAIATGECRVDLDAKRESKILIIELEGGLLMARLYQEDSSLSLIKHSLLERIIGQ